MTLKAFLFLFFVTIVAVVGAALIAEALLAPGFERGILIAVLAGLVVFPAARWAEYRGWIQGSWSPGGELRKLRDGRKAREAGNPGDTSQAAAAAEDPQPVQDSPRLQDQPHASAGWHPAIAQADDNKPSGDPR